MFFPLTTTDVVDNDELCLNPESIYCCKQTGAADVANPGFHKMQDCRQGTVMMNNRRRNQDRSRDLSREKRVQDVAKMEIKAAEHGFRSDQLSCPAVYKNRRRGKESGRIHKVCCEFPWTRTVRPRQCKLCK